MSQEVLYRKWRPRRFGDVAGQDPITTTLRHAVHAGSPAHAYLFTGPRGTGKTSTGRILAKAVNCTAPVDGEPCDACPSCESFNHGQAIDLIELDAASNRGIDEVRALRDSASYAPSVARYKVYLVDEVHMLTDPAFNALLKTLEEPPPHVIFVLATTEPHRIPPTITSRCQRYDFRRITLDAIVERLRTIAIGEGITIDDAGMGLVARQATGSLRDAVNLLDQLIAYRGHTLSDQDVQEGLGLVVDDRAGALARAAVARDLHSGLGLITSARDDGLELRAFLRQVVGTLRAALLQQAGAPDDASERDAAMVTELARAPATDIVRALRALGAVDFAGDPYDSLPAEIAFAALVVEPAPMAVAAGATAAPATVAPPRQAASPRPPAAPRATRSGPAAPPTARASAPAPARPRAAEVPPPEPERPPATPFEPPDEGPVPPELAALRGRWDEIRETVRHRDMKAGAMLNSGCYIKSVHDDTIELGFRFPKHVELVQTTENGRIMQAIQAVLIEIIGRPVRVVPVVWEALQRNVTAPPRARSSGGHLIEEARALGATVLESTVGGDE